MSKSLRNTKKSEVDEVARNRLANKTGGLGYWAAVDYTNRKKNKSNNQEKK